MLIKLDSHSHNRPNSSLTLNAIAVHGFNIQDEFSAMDFPPALVHCTWKEMELSPLCKLRW